MNVLVVIDKLSIDGLTPSCIALNLRDSHPLFLARDVHLTVCCLRREDPGADLVEAAGMPTVRLGRASYNPRIAPDLARTARRCAAEVLHAHGYASANFARLAGRRLRLPVIVHEHAVLPVRPHQWLADRFCRRWTTRGLAVSRAVADFMAGGRSIPRDRIDILPNGVNLESFYRMQGTAVEACRRQLGWPADGPLIGTAARFRREKGLAVLLAAAPKVLAEHPGACFVLAGEGPERIPLQKEAERLGVRQRVLFPGFIDDIPCLMRALSVLVIPSYSEGFSFAALEAMASGVPVVASRIGGLPEIIKDGGNGLLFPAGDAETLAGTLLRLLKDPGLGDRLARRGLEASRQYSMENYVDRLSTLYGHVSSRGNPADSRRATGETTGAS